MDILEKSQILKNRKNPIIHNLTSHSLYVEKIVFSSPFGQQKTVIVVNII
jgi:hypothetical protein